MNKHTNVEVSSIGLCEDGKHQRIYEVKIIVEERVYRYNPLLEDEPPKETNVIMESALRKWADKEYAIDFADWLENAEASWRQLVQGSKHWDWGRDP